MDEDYILDRFNLTGLNGDVVQEYQRALDLITDCLGTFSPDSWPSTPTFTLTPDDEALDDPTRVAVTRAARFLYGLIHARYIVTSRGLQKMVCPSLLTSNSSSTSTAKQTLAAAQGYTATLSPSSPSA